MPETDWLRVNSLAAYASMWENWTVLANKVQVRQMAGGETMTDPESEILTLDEVAVYLKAGKRTVYRLAQKGEIPGFKLGGSWRFRRSELDRWIASRIGSHCQSSRSDKGKS
ncbi:helix-turn-helix domain-containing protein [Burkholderia ambifaria]